MSTKVHYYHICQHKIHSSRKTLALPSDSWTQTAALFQIALWCLKKRVSSKQLTWVLVTSFLPSVYLNNIYPEESWILVGAATYSLKRLFRLGKIVSWEEINQVKLVTESKTADCNLYFSCDIIFSSILLQIPLIE
jgi:hypothetical protein